MRGPSMVVVMERRKRGKDSRREEWTRDAASVLAHRVLLLPDHTDEPEEEQHEDRIPDERKDDEGERIHGDLLLGCAV